MAEGQSNNNSLEFTPTWVVAVVCFVIVMLSLVAERGLHKLGKCLKRNNQDALFEALQKLKEELMLLGFISLLLTVTQNAIRKICMPSHLAAIMLPCKRKKAEGGNTEHYQLFLDQSLPARRHLLSSSAEAVSCSKGKVPLLSLEALHQLHIFIFVLAVVHVLFCATTMVLGGARRGTPAAHEHHHQLFLEKHSKGRCSNSSAFSWMVSFFKQFYGSITKSDYIALRQGFITLLLIVGAKLEHIIAQLAQEASEKNSQHNRRVETAAPERVEPSDKHFWFHRPAIALHLIHFILFQNSFEIAFFFWIWSTYGFDSCIMEKLGYIVPRLIMGVIVQVLCSYSTLPLYALVSQVSHPFITLFLVHQMGSRFKKGMFDDYVQSSLDDWLSSLRARREGDSTTNSHLDRLSTAHLPDAAEQEMVPISSAQNTSAVTHSPSSSV
ncbi:MLO-like protein 13 [Linum perenne]